MDAETSGGGIEASFVKGNTRGGSLETSGGGIEVSLDPEWASRSTPRATPSRRRLPVRVVGEISRRSLRGTLGRGGAAGLRTSGGGVRVGESL